MRRDWKELEVKDADHWMHLVEDRTWLSRQLKKAPSAEDEEAAEEADV